MTISKLKTSVRDYEAWLRKALDGDLVEDALIKKHEKMASDAFVFLRAAYWRWAETASKFCQGLDRAPIVVAIGDIHLENFGTWRDDEGRLVWGVNDFDEAAEMPYSLDLVRLAASALLAPGKMNAREICDAILAGYCEGLTQSRPFVLDAIDPRTAWLRRVVEASATERNHFWKKLKPSDEDNLQKIPRQLKKVLFRNLPGSAADAQTWPREAGTGSLGRPRWVAKTPWCGSPLVREAKCIVQSAWARVHDRKAKFLYCEHLANGRFRSPDPKYHLSGGIIVRRLSPNNRKIEIKDAAATLLAPRMLQAMGHEIANIHRGRRGMRAAIQKDLDRRPSEWLHRDATAAAAFTAREHKEWQSIWAAEEPTLKTVMPRKAKSSRGDDQPAINAP